MLTLPSPRGLPYGAIPLLLLIACSKTPTAETTPPTDTACPKDLLAAQGSPCAPDGKTCTAGPGTFNRLLMCNRGKWTEMNAPPPPPPQTDTPLTADAGPSVPFAVTALTAAASQTCARSTSETRCWGDTGFLTMADGAGNMQRARPTVALSLAGAPEIALSGAHGCARTKDGGVACWGSSTRGLLGDGKIRAPGSPSGGGGRIFCTGENERCAPTPIAGLRDVAQIAAGASHTCARLTAGTVLCWGQNEGGQLGDGTTTARPAPTAVPGVTDAVEIAAGSNHTCARRKDGTVSCWGANGSSQLGDGATKDRAAPAAVTGLRDVAQIACGGLRSCARLIDGTVSCWGEGQQRAAVAGLSAVADVVIGGKHACARGKDGAVRCWGDNMSGQLGDGTTERRAAPVTALTGATHLALGAWHTCAAVAGGNETWCWGRNGNHELGDGTTEERHVPTRVVYR